MGKNLAADAELSPSEKDQHEDVLEYDTLIAEVDAFLNAPDRTKNEIEFNNSMCLVEHCCANLWICGHN